MHFVHWLSDRHVQNLHSDITCRRVWLPPCCEKLGPTESHPHQPCLMLSRVCSHNPECIICWKHLRCVWESCSVAAKSYICSLFAFEVITFSLSVKVGFFTFSCALHQALSSSISHLPNESPTSSADRVKGETLWETDCTRQRKTFFFFLRYKMHSLMASTHVWPGSETSLRLSINQSVGVFNRWVWPVMTCCLRWSCAFLVCKIKLCVASI